ncbi:hypothetical protein SSX86_024322 [Deinandra increscens subsp. villosa]|uniref:VQ domain-containing protein n=1 Tax=Deinandra increscens subsp. villosa TaxID=3103831 RepID=A0AAP0CMM4_9ASTR
MEVKSIPPPDTETPSPANSPSRTTGSSTNSNGHPGATQTPPLTPRPTTRSDPNPYPTTFVQADTTSFKQVVQMLTGSSKDPAPSKISIPPVKTGGMERTGGISIPPVKTGTGKKQGFRLYERRNSLKNGLMINPSGHGHGLSPRVHEMLSPSILDFPALVLSPVTPLVEDPFNKSSPATWNSSEEERVIAEKGFYLHPSPRPATPRGTPEPQLLPLFPVTSPRVSSESSI